MMIKPRRYAADELGESVIFDWIVEWINAEFFDDTHLKTWGLNEMDFKCLHREAR